MINLGTEEIPWGFHIGFNIMVDFCVWVLEIDGLHVPPFDRHPDGNGTLRARGMDASAWQEWVAMVVATQDQRLIPFCYERARFSESSIRRHPVNEAMSLSVSFA